MSSIMMEDIEEDEIETVAPILNCADSVVFFMDVAYTWTEENHPRDFPKDQNPYWSPIYGIVHNE